MLKAFKEKPRLLKIWKGLCCFRQITDVLTVAHSDIEFRTDVRQAAMYEEIIRSETFFAFFKTQQTVVWFQESIL